MPRMSHGSGHCKLPSSGHEHQVKQSAYHVKDTIGVENRVHKQRRTEDLIPNIATRIELR